MVPGASAHLQPKWSQVLRGSSSAADHAAGKGAMLANARAWAEGVMGQVGDEHSWARSYLLAAALLHPTTFAAAGADFET